MEVVVGFQEIAYESFKVFLVTHALYWVFVFICPYVFPTVYPMLDAGKQSYWAASMISCVMSNVIAYKTFSMAYEMKMYYLYFDYDHLWTDSRAAELCYIIIGYFASDLAVGFYYHDKWPGHMANYIHHIAGMIAFYHLATWNMGHGMALSTFMLEITNGFNNLRWFLDTAGVKKTSTIYMANGVLFTLSFFIIRIVAFTFSGFHYFYIMRDQFYKLPIEYIGLTLSTYSIAASLQYFWFSKLSVGLYKMLTKKQKKV